MAKFVINGGKTLSGEIPVHGAKNSALKIVAGSLLSDQPITITNIPEIVELQLMFDLLTNIGAKVEYSNGKAVIDTSSITSSELPGELVRKTRSSILMVGPLLARKGHVRFPHPGGCALGKRPIDFFLSGFKKMGAVITESDEYIDIHVDGKLKGCNYFFPRKSHTGTESMMMTACLASGQTILENAACEPEIVALADYLNTCGAKIQGAGTNTIIIEGVPSLSAGTFNTIPDRLEAGTFAILAALCADKLKITNCNPSHLSALWERFDMMGIRYELGSDYVIVYGDKDLNYKSVDIFTREYPGFATDIQAPFTVLLTQCNGVSLVHETIFDGRLFYIDSLNQMGASITMCDPHRVLVHGPAKLTGRRIISPDIRAGMAMVLAALKAEGESIISNIYQVDRGYSLLEQRLTAIGADIKRL